MESKHVIKKPKKFPKLPMPALEARKKELESRRKHYKSITTDELHDHRSKYEQIKRMKEIEREKKFKNAKRQRIQNKKQFYESSYMMRVKDLEKKIKTKKQRQSLERSMLKNKQKKYSQIVRKMIDPLEKSGIAPLENTFLTMKKKEAKKLSKMKQYS